MKRIEIQLTCDAHAAWQGQPDMTKGVETVSVSAGQTLDLCPEHRDALQRVWALVAEWGAAPEGKRRANSVGSKRHSTPVAPTNGAQAPAQAGNAPSKRGGARARQRRQSAQAAALELVCPLCQQPAASSDSLGHHLSAAHHTTGSAVYGGTCPVCNYSGSPRGLGTHAGTAHGITGVAALFAAAQQQGDPHGVIAARAQVMASAQ